LLYEYECQSHGRFEMARPVSECDETGNCPVCKTQCERVPSLPAMRPDDMWHGVTKEGYGTFTSRSAYNAELRRRNHVPLPTRQDREDFEKLAANARKDKEEKFKGRMRKLMEAEFGPSGRGLGGADGRKAMEGTGAEKVSPG
jgi:putative FmdB family regulatory protein